MRSFLAVLRTLADHKVDFVVVGGVAAVLRGAPINTFDLDVVHSTDGANVDRVLAAVLRLLRDRSHQPPYTRVL